MLDDVGIYAVLARLALAANDERLASTARTRAVELSGRLSRGVRIVLLGPAGVGKSSLCDVLLNLPDETRHGGCGRVFTNAQAGRTDAPAPDGVTSCAIDPDTLGPAEVVDMPAPLNEQHSVFETLARSAQEGCTDIRGLTSGRSQRERHAQFQRTLETLKEYAAT